MNGLDSAKEVELYAFAREFLARGMSAVLFDGPGQGVLAGLHPMVPDFEHVFESVLSTVHRLDGVDRDRIGLFGVSYGGYLVSRSGAFFPREVKAVVNLSGGYDHDNYLDINVMVRKDFRYVFGQPDDASMDLLAREQLNLRGVPPLAAPLLMVHGEKDGIIPYESCLRLLEWADGEKELILYPGERHVCTNYFSDFIPRMSDWLADALLSPRS
jgi:alpha-beta hydrolase superfamily lysophospholipase